ncbi:MAG: cytidine deaminase [Leptospira sp.]|nr:cytidine deaminase [Leptospira sp.]
MKSTDPELINPLRNAAMQAASHAYCKYSEFSVGAALVSDAGKIYAGCNVENISYGLTNCAERTAIFSAVADGVKPGEIRTLVFYMPGNKLYTPCGACRQVMAEFMEPESIVIATCDTEETKTWKLSDLLPEGFQF